MSTSKFSYWRSFRVCRLEEGRINDLNEGDFVADGYRAAADLLVKATCGE